MPSLTQPGRGQLARGYPGAMRKDQRDNDPRSVQEARDEANRRRMGGLGV